MTSPASEIRVEADGAIVAITIDRGHKRNSLTIDVCRDIADAAEAAAEVPEQRVIPLRGEGRTLCAGADLSDQHHEDSSHEQLHRMLYTIEVSRLVAIADVQGLAVRVGMQLAMAADLHVVDERDWFMIPLIKLGIAVDTWTVHCVCVLAGGTHARTILLAAERMDQEATRDCGLASCPGGPDKVEGVALRIATYVPLSPAYHKAMPNDDGIHSPLKDYQQEFYDTVQASEDAAKVSKVRAEKCESNLIGKQVEQVQ